jgi:hypothetical protein
VSQKAYLATLKTVVHKMKCCEWDGDEWCKLLMWQWLTQPTPGPIPGNQSGWQKWKRSSKKWVSRSLMKLRRLLKKRNMVTNEGIRVTELPWRTVLLVGYSTVWVKKEPLHFCPNLGQIMTDFQNSFTAAVKIKFTYLTYWFPWQPFLFPPAADEIL